MNGHCSLVVIRSGESLRLLGRDRGVLVDQRCRHATHGFDTQGQRGNVQQQNVFHITGEHGRLDGSTHGYSFIRVHVLTRFLTEEVLHFFLNHRHAGLTADQDDFVDFTDLGTGIFQRGAARRETALDQLFNQ